MNRLSTNNKELLLNKHLQTAIKDENLVISLIDCFSLNGYKLNTKRKLIPLIDTQINYGLKRLVIKKSFFRNHKSLLFDLMDLSPKHRSVILIIVLQTVFRISLVNKEVVIS